jgi:hypothetical protein
MARRSHAVDELLRQQQRRHLRYTLTASGATFDATTGAAFLGPVASFTSTDPSATAADFTATINWGDGTRNSTGVITGTNPFTITSVHTFKSFLNIDLVTITIVDQNGRTVTGIDRVVDPPAVVDV